jgi:hypothetical protein
MKCDFCASDFVRKETYKAHVISHHKRHISEEEFDEVMDKIKKFQPPSLDINEFTLEKQKNRQVVKTEECLEEDVEMAELEMIDDDSQAENEITHTEEVENEYYDENEYDDEQ